MRAVLCFLLCVAGAIVHGEGVRYCDATYIEPKLSLYDATRIGGGETGAKMARKGATTPTACASVLLGVVALLRLGVVGALQFVGGRDKCEAGPEASFPAALLGQ